MKFELNRPTDYSEEAILKEIQRVASFIEKPLSKTKFNENSKYSASTIEKRLSGWTNALKKAGLDESYLSTLHKKENKKTNISYDKSITKEDLIVELKKVSEKVGSKSFTAKEFENISNISRTIFSIKFGSFNKMMKEIGFIAPLKSRKYKDDERFENLLKVWTFYGRQPNYGEMKKEPSEVGPKAYVIRWGSWRNALIAFLEKINTVVTDENPKENINKKSPDNKINSAKEDKRDISIGLRFDIFKRDNFKCVLCGRSPSSTFGVELQVDHIIPFSKGGKTEKNNLQTLCNQCNIGKSDKM